jgi:hypothetical protein
LPIVLKVSSGISGVVAAYQQIISRIRMDNVPGVSAFRQPTMESAGRLTGIDKNTESTHAVRSGAWSDGKPAIRGMNYRDRAKSPSWPAKHVPAKAGGRPSTSLLPAQRGDVDADPSLGLGQTLRRHDDVEATVAPRGALISRRILRLLSRCLRRAAASSRRPRRLRRPRTRGRKNFNTLRPARGQDDVTQLLLPASSLSLQQQSLTRTRCPARSYSL